MRSEGRRGTGIDLSVLRIALIVAVAVTILAAPSSATRYTTEFLLEACTWSSVGTQNPYFSLEPGYQLVLEGEEDGEPIVAQITVCDGLATCDGIPATEEISFTTAKGVALTVETRVVEEREWEDGELVEVSRNWLARCMETGALYYFGEDVDDYEDGEIVGHEGAWRSGVEGALPGLMMPATYVLGAKYYQELAPEVALDRAKHVRMGLDVVVPAGFFTDCVAVVDSSPLDPGARDLKVYCPGVGVVMDEDLALTEINYLAPAVVTRILERR